MFSDTLKRLVPGGVRGFDRLALFASVGGLLVISWWYLVHLWLNMSEMPMDQDGHAMMTQSWNMSEFVRMLLMWVVMMVAMMVPTAVRSVLMFERISQLRTGSAQVALLVFWFVGGYVIAWSAFGLVATIVQLELQTAALLTENMSLASPIAGAGVLIAAGVWQLTPIKNACLRHCRSPVDFLLHHYRPGGWGATRTGVLHGLYCLGCCWVLMGLLFVGGVMSLAWIIGLTAFVLVEKLLPGGEKTARLFGVMMILTGVAGLLWPGVLVRLIH